MSRKPRVPRPRKTGADCRPDQGGCRWLPDGRIPRHSRPTQGRRRAASDIFVSRAGTFNPTWPTTMEAEQNYTLQLLHPARPSTLPRKHARKRENLSPLRWVPTVSGRSRCVRWGVEGQVSCPRPPTAAFASSNYRQRKVFFAHAVTARQQCWVQSAGFLRTPQALGISTTRLRSSRATAFEG